MKHPQQPIVRDEHGVTRFKANPIVRTLLDIASTRGLGLNEIACMGFSDEDRAHFAQLIGYSVSGYRGLSYVQALEEEEENTEIQEEDPAEGPK